MFNIINRKTLLDYSKIYPKAKNALFEWYYEFLTTSFKNFQELKSIYGNASLVGDDRVVINIMGNKYRLVIRIVFLYKTIQIKWFGTHKEYDEIDVATVKFKS
ncbi:type II toxin-antitoxin system HigB family toxin [Pedobacter aquatilis]|uniref:type II toxin-antitoxin system HigB family toxin n=1 Tax=Pedobacter aquatilis TaxID=351343 RepID=UPI0025B613D9|nr:type II toxin-antitoxin system HigB family toxin [Pedobacter aquatilis]MDN3585775.1 type II toxin-antitoxin system HigB family toxin [Pedobacter aquatilis]